MKTEAETGFEPSLLVYMLRQQTQDNRVYRTARILKDRSLQIEGQDFQFPVSSDFTEIARGVFRVFKPHIDRLNLGGSHSGFDESRTSAGMIPPNEKNEYKARQQRREILIDEIKKLAEKHFGGQSQDMKRARDDLLEKHFNTRSWVKLEQSEEHYPNEFLRDGYDAMHTELEGMPAYGGPPNQEAA
jgi:hypothetical protein